MGRFDGMELTLSGLDAIDMLTSITTVHTGASFEVYEKTHFYQDVAVMLTVRVDVTSLDYTFALMVHYGYKLRTNPTPTRVSVGFTFAWGVGDLGPEGMGSISGPIEVADGKTLFSGESIPPTVFTWNGATQSQIGETYFGYPTAFVKSGTWLPDPASTGVLDNFYFRFDPSLEDTSYDRMMRGVGYGGAWLDSSDGKWVRLDLLEIQLDNGVPWFLAQGGTAWWMQKAIPRSTGGWDNGRERYPDRAHQDSGVGPFLRCYVNSNEQIHSDPAWMMAVKKGAATWVAKMAPPNTPWANEFHTNYGEHSGRSQGRVLSSGIWFWRALLTMEPFRSSDAELTSLKNAIGTKVFQIFGHIFLLNEPGSPVRGFWQRFGGINTNHPDAGCGSVPSGEKLIGFQPFMHGIQILGLIDFMEVLEDFELTHLPEYDQARLIAEFIFIGYTPTSVDGLFDIMFNWSSANPPRPAPSPIPPAWACKTSWPTPKFHDSGWSWEYESYENNVKWSTVNADIQYLSNPTNSLTGHQIAGWEYFKRNGFTQITNRPPSQAKMDSVIAALASRVGYRWRLGNEPISDNVPDTLAVSDDVRSVLTQILGAQLVSLVPEEAQISEDVTSVISSASVIDDDCEVSEGVNSLLAMQIFNNEQVEMTDDVRSVITGTGQALVSLVDDEIDWGAAPGQDEVISVFIGRHENANTPLVGIGISVNAALLGGSG